MKRYRYSALLLFIFGLYAATGWWGLSLSPISGFATLVWPPTGIALAALYFLGLRMWPAVAFGALFINFLIGAPLWVALIIATGNTLEMVVGAYMLRTVFDFNPLFRRLWDTLYFIFVCTLTPVIAATVGTFALVLGGMIAEGQILFTWSAWWIGDSLGSFILGGFLLRWLFKPRFVRSRNQWIELSAAFSLLIAANFAALMQLVPIFNYLPITYFFVPYLWLAIREGARAITLASLIVSGFLVFETIAQIGLFAGQPLLENMFLSQMLLGILATIFLVIAATMEERRVTNALLQRNISELERALRRVRSANKAKNDFIAILAHELRNPLAPIVTSLEILSLDKGEDEEHRRLRERMASSAQTMRTLLDDLLDISRITRRGFRLQKSRVDLRQIIQTSVASVEGLMRDRKHTLTIIPSEEPLWVDVDPMRIEQVLVNILNNAGKYTENGGRIMLLSTRTKKEAVIKISDTGIGIAAERLPYIFEPFQRSSASQARAGGLGIGLSLSYRLLKLHGGTIEVASKGEGTGSTFTISIPLIHAEQLSVALPAGKELGARKKPTPSPLNIVLIDDNEAALATLEALLETEGHTIQTAGDGRAGVQKILLEKPDVAIVDIGLPDVDGYQVARSLRRQGFTGMLIALSGYGQDEDKQKAYAAGFEHHLTKPARLSDIQSILLRAKSAAEEVAEPLMKPAV
ncbi:response regulator [Candidatus Parcubacteria bacterium]|nr:MAG: response regulator [Candidatus Parcubacteria bacterium]